MSTLVSPGKYAVEAGIPAPGYRLPAASRVGRVRLAVSNLKESVAFYTEIIGLSVLPPLNGQSPNLVRLGVPSAEDVLLELQGTPGVNPIGQRTRLGLYHTAFLLPSRDALSSFVQHLIHKDVDFGSSDHLYSEAVYLTDPDGLSVEVYADRPRSQWTVEGNEVVAAVNPLRLDELLSVAKESWSGAPAGTTIGHVHLYVGNLDQARSFYHNTLGLDLMTWRYPGALFTSAGGYHHHVGLNVWAAGSPPASEEDARLLFWELVLPGAEDVARAQKSFENAGYAVGAGASGGPMIADPWGINVLLVAPGK